MFGGVGGDLFGSLFIKVVPGGEGVVNQCSLD